MALCNVGDQAVNPSCSPPPVWSRPVGVDAYGQVWDAVEGDIVWEGVGAARAMSSEFTYVKDQSIDTYSAITARALVAAIVGR